jgi:hypothetical protein
MSHIVYRKTKLLVRGKLPRKETVFTTPPDATTISIHYLGKYVKGKCDKTDLLGL